MATSLICNVALPQLYTGQLANGRTISSPRAALMHETRVPMRSYEIKNSTLVEEVKKLRLVTTIKTLYLPDGRFDLRAYDELVNMQIGQNDVIVGGTTREGQLMSWDEHIMLIAHTVNCFGDRIKVIGNIGSNSTREAIHTREQFCSRNASCLAHQPWLTMAKDLLMA